MVQNIFSSPKNSEKICFYCSALWIFNVACMPWFLKYYSQYILLNKLPTKYIFEIKEDKCKTTIATGISLTINLNFTSNDILI